MITDDQDIVGNVKRVLLQSDADLMHFKTPSEALLVLDAGTAQTPVSAILIDVLACGNEGAKLVGQLRARSAATIVLVAAMSSQTLAEMRNAWGADAHLVTNRGLLHMKAAFEALSTGDSLPPVSMPPVTRPSASMPSVSMPSATKSSRTMLPGTGPDDGNESW
jgi:DNA-binding response OmpR family regulator